MGTYLGFDQNKINEEHDKVMLNILVGELLATRTLCQTHSFTERVVVRFAIGSVEMRYGI